METPWSPGSAFREPLDPTPPLESTPQTARSFIRVNEPSPSPFNPIGITSGLWGSAEESERIDEANRRARQRNKLPHNENSGEEDENGEGMSHDAYGIPNKNGTWSCAYPGCTSRAVFTRACDLRKHYKRHTKTFFCRHGGCPQATGGGFSSKKDLARHEAKHNPGFLCEWEGCGRVFSRVGNMKDHMRRIHLKASQDRPYAHLTPPQTSRAPLIDKRKGISKLAQSPPLEFVEPVGQEHQFRFTGPRTPSLGPRSSSEKSEESEEETDLEAGEDEKDESASDSAKHRQPLRRVVAHAQFVLEELDSDETYDSDVEVLRPSHVEDGESETGDASTEEKSANLKLGLEGDIVTKFQDPECRDESSDENEWQRLYKRETKRRSAGIVKRTHSHSIEGDSSYSDNDPLDDLDWTARRLRRRVRGSGGPSSLVFEDTEQAGSLRNTPVNFSSSGGLMKIGDWVSELKTSKLAEDTEGNMAAALEKLFTIEEPAVHKFGDTSKAPVNSGTRTPDESTSTQELPGKGRPLPLAPGPAQERRQKHEARRAEKERLAQKEAARRAEEEEVLEAARQKRREKRRARMAEDILRREEKERVRREDEERRIRYEQRREARRLERERIEQAEREQAKQDEARRRRVAREKEKRASMRAKVVEVDTPSGQHVDAELETQGNVEAEPREENEPVPEQVQETARVLAEGTIPSILEETANEANVTGQAERRRIQNKLAQRRFRVKVEEQVKLAETGEMAKLKDDSSNQKKGDILMDPLPGVQVAMKEIDARPKKEEPGLPLNDPGLEVGADKPDRDTDNSAGPSTIKCICRFSDDKRHIVQCEKCGTSQHIACYYEDAREIVEIHECVECSSKALNRHSTRDPSEKGASQVKSTYASDSITRVVPTKSRAVGESSIGFASKSVSRSVAATSEGHHVPATNVITGADILEGSPVMHPSVPRRKPYQRDVIPDSSSMSEEPRKNSDNPDSPSSNNLPTSTGTGNYLIEQRRPTGVSRKPSTQDTGRVIKPEIIIEFGSKKNAKKKYPLHTHASSSRSYKQSSLGISSAASDEVAIESPGSDASYTIPTGFPEAPILPSEPLGYARKAAVPRGIRSSSTESFTFSSQPPSLYMTSEPESPSGRRPARFPPTIVHQPPPFAVHSASHNKHDPIPAAAYRSITIQPERHGNRERTQKLKEEVTRQEEADRRLAEELAKEEVRQDIFELGCAEGRPAGRVESKFAKSEKTRAEAREDARRRKKEQAMESAERQLPESEKRKAVEREGAGRRKGEHKTKDLEKSAEQLAQKHTRRSLHTRRRSISRQDLEERIRLLAETEAQMARERELAEARERQEKTQASTRNSSERSPQHAHRLAVTVEDVGRREDNLLEPERVQEASKLGAKAKATDDSSAHPGGKSVFESTGNVSATTSQTLSSVKEEGPTKTPITPPTAYLDFAKTMSPTPTILMPSAFIASKASTSTRRAVEPTETRLYDRVKQPMESTLIDSASRNVDGNSRRVVRSLVMQKAQRERPWSAQQHIPKLEQNIGHERQSQQADRTKHQREDHLQSTEHFASEEEQSSKSRSQSRSRTRETEKRWEQAAKAALIAGAVDAFQTRNLEHGHTWKSEDAGTRQTIENTPAEIRETPRSSDVFVRALYDYDSEDQSNLKFRLGDLILVTAQHESGWWAGIRNGILGWFPSNYCAASTGLDDSGSDGKYFYVERKVAHGEPRRDHDPYYERKVKEIGREVDTISSFRSMDSMGAGEEIGRSVQEEEKAEQAADPSGVAVLASAAIAGLVRKNRRSLLLNSTGSRSRSRTRERRVREHSQSYSRSRSRSRSRERGRRKERSHSASQSRSASRSKRLGTLAAMAGISALAYAASTKNRKERESHRYSSRSWSRARSRSRSRSVYLHRATSSSPLQSRTTSPSSPPPREATTIWKDTDIGSYALDFVPSGNIHSSSAKQSWSRRLRDYCSAQGLGEPTWQDVPDNRGFETTWLSMVIIQGVQYRPVFRRDHQDLEDSREEAAEVAFKQLIGAFDNGPATPPPEPGGPGPSALEDITNNTERGQGQLKPPANPRQAAQDTGQRLPSELPDDEPSKQTPKRDEEWAIDRCGDCVLDASGRRVPFREARRSERSEWMGVERRHPRRLSDVWEEESAVSDDEGQKVLPTMIVGASGGVTGRTEPSSTSVGAGVGGDTDDTKFTLADEDGGKQFEPGEPQRRLKWRTGEALDALEEESSDEDAMVGEHGLIASDNEQQRAIEVGLEESPRARETFSPEDSHTYPSAATLRLPHETVDERDAMSSKDWEVNLTRQHKSALKADAGSVVPSPEQFMHTLESNVQKMSTEFPYITTSSPNDIARKAFKERKQRPLKDLEADLTRLEEAAQNAQTDNDLVRKDILHLQKQLETMRANAPPKHSPERTEEPVFLSDSAFTIAGEESGRHLNPEKPQGNPAQHHADSMDALERESSSYESPEGPLIAGASDQICYRCGNQGHDTRYCTQDAGLGYGGFSGSQECYKCGKRGHIARNCPQGAGMDYGGYAAAKSQICYNCGSVGHMNRECPQKHKCYNCGELGHLLRDCPFDMGQGFEKALLTDQKEPEMAKPDEASTHSPEASENIVSSATGISDDQLDTKMERTLRALFAKVLGIDAANITRDDNFHFLGKDSPLTKPPLSLRTLAIRLEVIASEHGVEISSLSVLNHPILRDMAKHAHFSEGFEQVNRHLLEEFGLEDRAATDLQVPTMEPATPVAGPDMDFEIFEPHLFAELKGCDDENWQAIHTRLPEAWRWDVDYHTTHSNGGKDHGCCTCTPVEPDDPKNFPLTIAGTPVVLPVEHQWPPMAGVNPPPDPRPSAPIDCTSDIPLEVVRDLFLTFEGSVGFYLLINGLLQIIVPEGFDTVWASSHLPHKYGGLKVCYIPQTVEPTMFPSKTETTKSKSSPGSQSSGISSIFRPSKTSNISLSQPLQINDFIEARAKSSHRKEKFAGRIGLKITKCGDPYLVMSTHVITEAILAKSHIAGIFSKRDRFEKLDDNWNDHVEIWAGNEKIGTVEQTFDNEAEIYPNGFKHDITLIKSTNPSAIKDIQSPIPNLGWLGKESWYSLRQQTSGLKILGPTESHRCAKTLRTNRPSEILVVGEGIFLNQSAGPKPTKDHDMSTWKDLVSRAVLYRVYPDFDPPNGYSGVALYAEGMREDGTEGPGVVGFQSFVQRSGHVQNFEMEGGALEKRLKLGRVAFYGAFQVPEGLRKEFGIV